jgi:signal transduction histidine kinase
MSGQLQVVLIAAGCTSAVGLAGVGLVRLLRRASLRLSIQASGTVPVLAIVAGTMGTAEAMFLSQHDLGVVVMICVIAGMVASGFSWLLGRPVESGSAALRRAARSLGDETGRFRPPELPLAAEFASLSQELADTSAKLARSRARERALEQSRRQLVAWVSHDLRTPLAGLRAMAEALEDGLAADPPRYHKQIRSEVERLGTMVDDLFELSRIHSGALQLSHEEITLDDLVSDVLASTEALAGERGVRLAGKAAGQITVRADPRELSRALTNLLTNAIRFTPPGGSVNVEARREQQDALLAVADTCGGIPEADLPHVFDLAWRGTAARSPEPDSGAGLGLAIVRGIVEAHQGSVRVANTGDGCRFEIRLPARS